MDQRWGLSPMIWTGVIECLDDHRVMALAHGQEALMFGPTLIAGRKYTLYEFSITYVEKEKKWKIEEAESSECVLCPTDDCCDIMKVKDVCAGIGGITQGLEHVGFHRLASMDCQELMCNTMSANGMGNVVQGNANNPRDRAKFHCTPDQTRCLIASGFPCQPLSSQGDGRGAEDQRSLVFDAVIDIAWEQQCAGLLLENVIKALQATYIQKKIQKLAWSMGMQFDQVILKLDKAWPCRRTRWWMMMIPKEYQIPKLMDLPLDPNMQRLDNLLPVWPRWSDHDEDILRLTSEELQMLHNPQYGNDVRVLQNDKHVPCILHSYANGLTSCPCGCRSAGFAQQRLDRDGLRGFYVHSQRDGHPRWLHPAEASLLCGVDPLLHFPDPKAGLCLVGQCASALQATWMGAHVVQAIWPQMIDPVNTLISAKMWLLRQAHGMIPSAPVSMVAIDDQREGTRHLIRIEGECTVAQLRRAEERLQGPGHRIQVGDLLGDLPGHYRLTSGPVQGDLQLDVAEKRQRLTRVFRVLKVDVADGHNDHSVYVSLGTFIFEVLHRLPIDPYQMICMDSLGETFRPDDRLWEDTSIYLAEKKPLTAMGPGSALGLGDRQIDRQAMAMLSKYVAENEFRWLPSAKFTDLFHNMEDEDARGAILSVTRQKLGSCVALQGHWLLIVMFLDGHTLHVECWDGLDHSHRQEILCFADDMKASLWRAAHIKTRIVSFHTRFGQHHPMTCGTIALMHLGHILGCWTAEKVPDELSLHMKLQDEVLPCVLRANGKPHTEEEMKHKIRELLHEHGVAPEDSEERFHAALKKIGHQKISDALSARNCWAALKSAGSQPKINFLWIRPEELDKQIRKRAESKYKASSSHKKGGNRAKPAQINMDPAELELLPNTFVTEDDRVVSQISIEEVASDRTGIAFGTLADAGPFLKNDKSITLDALAILTTMPVPPTEQGLMPVTNLRYPAKYGPTQEAILIEGSLIQLGDCSILRKQADAPTKVEPIETRVYKISVWKDEWSGAWDSFITNPVKSVTKVFPRLLLCKGDRCGQGCARFHAPVDSEVDNVIVDLWGRAFLTMRGKRVAAEQSDL